MGEKRYSLVALEWFFFVIVMVLQFFSTQTYFGTANYPRIYKIDFLCILLFIVLLILSNKGKLIFDKRELISYKIILYPYILLSVLSLIYCITLKKINFSDMLYYNMQPILVCLLAIMTHKVFGKKAFRGILVSSLINYTAYVIACVLKYGPLSLFSAGTDNAASRLLEVHEITFIFGMMTIYFVISNYFKDKSIKKIWVFVVGIYSVLGFKRILVLAMVLAYILYKLLKKKRKVSALVILSVVIMLFNIVWVYICSSWDNLMKVSSFFNIDLKGRNWIYSNFYSYFEFAIDYVGAGIGYVQTLIENMSTMVIGGHQIGLHNELLRLFIELGFVPFVFYFALIFPISILVINKKFGYEQALNYFIIWLMTWVCIITDNLLTYPNYMLTFLIIILEVINKKEEELIE